MTFLNEDDYYYDPEDYLPEGDLDLAVDDIDENYYDEDEEAANAASDWENEHAF